MAATDARERLGRPSSAEAAGEAFEAYLVGFLAKEMRAAVPDGPFSTGPAAMFADLFDEEIGRRVASGPGIGLKGEIARALAGRDLGEIPGHAQPPLTPVSARVTSAFGMRVDPLEGGLRRHDGLDVGAATGSPIRAAQAGVVRFAGARGGYGNVVILDHGGGVETRYAHCAAVSVATGARVAAGEHVAIVGSTGRSTGPNLHFEVRKDGAPVDPAEWLEATFRDSPANVLVGRR